MIEIENIPDVEKYLDQIDAVIFDLDDTLYSEKEYVRSGYRKIADWLHKPEVEERLWEVFLRGGKALDEVLDTKDVKEALAIYRHQKPDIHLYPGVAEMLYRIRKTKKIGMITDGRPEGQHAKLDALGIRSYFDEIIITDEMGGVQFRKPNPKAFREMQARMERPFERMCYVGDNPGKDFIAPEQLGMRAIYFRNPDGLYTV